MSRVESNNSANTYTHGVGSGNTISIPSSMIIPRHNNRLRTIFVIDDERVIITFTASSLYDAFIRCYEHYGYYFRLYWNFQQINPYATFSDYNMGDPIEFILEEIDMVGIDVPMPRLPEFSDTDTDLSDEEIIFDNPQLQAGKSFGKMFTEVEEYEPFVKLTEDICCLIYQLKQSRSVREASVCVGSFIRSTTGRSNVYFYKDMCSKFIADFRICFNLQSDGHWTSELSDFYENYSRCKDSEISRRLKTFFNHLIMHCVYHKLGIEVDSEIFDKLEKHKIRPNLLNCLTFLDACASLLIFLLKQGRQVMITGDIEHLFIDGDSLSAWTLRAKKLKMNAEFLGNPNAVGLDVHTYIKDLESCIADSKSLTKFMKVNTPEGKYFHSIQFELQAIEKRYLTVTAAQSIRKAPLAFIIYGESGIGKSSILTVISDFDARRRGRNTDPTFRYTVTAESEYYDGFRSNMHTVIIDDAAIHEPSKIQGIDPTISDVMRIGNGIAWCPPQAAIEDKGRTPMLANLLMVTSNVPDLNIPIYYKASYAAMRRLKFRIEPIVKEQYAGLDKISLDSSKCGGDTNYPDYWTFKISIAVRKDNMRGAYEPFAEFNNMAHFLFWLGTTSDLHDKEQELWLKNSSSYDVTLCEHCLNPDDMCLCAEAKLQNLREIDGKAVWVADLTPEEIELRQSYRIKYGSGMTDDEKNEEKFRAEFLTAHGSFNLFNSVKEEIRPWRTKTYESKKKRLYTAELSKKFIKLFSDKALPLHLEYYAYKELPSLLTTGWKDEDILHDFFNYSTYCTENAAVDDILQMATFFVENEISIPNQFCLGGFMDALFKMIVSIYFYSAFVRSSVQYISKFKFIRTIAMKFLRPCLLRTENQKFFVKKLGTEIDKKLGGSSNYIKYALGFLSVSSVAAVAYAFWNRSQNTVDDPIEVTSIDNDTIHDDHTSDNPTDEVLPESIGPVVQALRDFGTYPKPSTGDDKVNMWAVEDRAITTVDFVPNLCRDTVGLERKLCRNTLVFETFEPTSSGAWKYSGILTILSNEHFLTNSHSIPKGIDCKFRVYLGRNHLVSPKIEFVIKQSQIERIPERDIAIVRTNNFPALFTDISRNFVKSTYNGVYDGFYLIKQMDGSMKKVDVLNIRKMHLTRTIQGIFFDMEVFQGKASSPTELGDCGAPLIANTGYGPVIVGFHMIYDEPNVVFAAKFSYDDFNVFSKQMQVQVGKIPVGDIEVYLAKKSYIDFHETGNLVYHGELKTFRSRPHHNVVDSELASQIYGKTLNNVVLERRLCGPVMDSWRAQQTGLKEFLQPVKYMDEDVLQEISDVWTAYILKHLAPSELDLVEPCCLDAAVNGVPGMAYVDSIKRSTSMGFPYYTTKKAYLQTLEDDRWPDGVKFTPAVEQKISEWMELLRNGIRLHAVFGSNLKDEAVSFKKFEAWKTRIFFSCPAELLVIVRMFYLGFARVVQRNRSLFWVAIGLNTTSPEWEDLFQILSKFGVDTCIAGDHVYYDKRVKMLVMYYVMDAINRICIASGKFTEEMQLMMNVLKYELMNPTVDFFGMLITLLGGEVSGHQLTTIFNCVLNIFYLMYAYKKAGYDLADFFDNVVGVILGDDHVLCVSLERPLYHHTHIKNTLEGLGLGYTMADKSSESTPYISLYEASFLKRTFVYDVKLGLHVGPLEFNSIVKMLTIQVKSKTVMLSTQLAQAISSAMSEMFFYGEEAFDEFRLFVMNLEKSPSLKEQMLDFPLLTFDVYKRRFWNSSKNKAYDTGLQSQKIHVNNSYCSDSTSILNEKERVDYSRYHARAFPEIHFHGSMELDTQQNCKNHETKLSQDYENHQLSKTNEQMNAIQSEIPMTEGSESSTSQQTQFVNETASETLEMGVPHDMTARSMITDSHLAEYLSRPTKIHSFIWTENAAAGNISTITPWGLFFNNANIRTKLDGFGYIRCKLHLKFTINASQFYYGSLGAFYTPMQNVVQDTTGLTYGYAAGFQVLQSQKPHVWLDPQTTSTAVMELPFLYNRHFLNATVLSEFNGFGEIDFTQFAALRSANGVTTTGVNVVVYAWATDVELTGLTSRAVLQSKKEYVGNGQISGPASTVANVAKRMSDIPIIGPFAKATEMAAGAVGGIASMFGFTNVPNVRDVEPFKPTSFHTLASSEISEPINKLSLQPKQEVAVDSTFAGDPTADQLHITNFCQRESFLCGALWTTTAVEDSIVFTSYVTPQLYEKSTGSNPHVYSVPMSYIANMFEKWRGDLIFRFKVIKTQYHRGRLSISWDPLQTSMANMPSYGNPRVQNIIFDLEDTDTIEVRVPYMQATPFTTLRDGSTTVDGPWWSNGPTPNQTAAFGTQNGIIQVRVVNRLTAPEATSDVDVLVFVRAADNIEFASPNEILNKTHMVLQSKKEFVMGQPSDSDPMSYSEVYGEKISSLRQLLHRQSKASTQVIPRTANWDGSTLIATFPFQRVPKYYGYTGRGGEQAFGTIAPATGFGFNFVRIHPICWLQPCFLGTRGSTNWTFNVVNNDGKSTVPVMSIGVCRNPDAANNKAYYYAIPGTLSTSSLMKEHNNSTGVERQGAQGMALTNQYTQSGISVNLPYYNRYKFLVNNAFLSYNLTDSGNDEKNTDWFELTVKRGITPATTDSNVFIDTYVGTGPDFDFVFFINCPVFTYLVPPPAFTTG